MSQFTLQQLAAGIKDRNEGANRTRLVEKWSRTGLLRGLDGYKREVMSQLLENQAAQVLRESNALSTGGGAVASSGQIQGFTNIQFPIVRRVFGGLVANELVSIQPMSLPSGLIFYLDYTYGSNVGGDGEVAGSSSTFETYQKGKSIYNTPTGKGVQSGSLATGGMYDLVNTGYSKVHSGTLTLATASVGSWTGAAEAWVSDGIMTTVTDFTGTNARMLSFDPQIEADLSANNLDVQFCVVAISDLLTSIPKADLTAIDQFAVFGFSSNGSAAVWGDTYQSGYGVYNLRRTNRRGNFSAGVFTPDAMNGTHILTALRIANAGTKVVVGSSNTKCSIAIGSGLSVDAGSGATLTIPSFETNFGATPSPAIPEIDIKIESIAITATTRKLRARWSPELAQDLNAYHSMDAEVELTGILSENIALEIDREILSDLVTNANGANLYWSRAPGKFVNKLTGANIQMASSLSIGPQFTGNVQEWYQTLIETIVDCANSIQRKTLRGSANFIVTGPDVCTILESTVAYKPKYTLDSEGQVGSPFTIGCESIGTISNRFTCYKDLYFPRNKVLLGYKGGTYLECGYAYCPYVPLLMTPTIFRPEDFAPTRGVMTRYAKKCIRSDFFGTVTITDMNII